MSCPVCLTPAQESLMLNLKCLCTFCVECLTSWIVTKNKAILTKNPLQIPCMNKACDSRFQAQEVLHKFPPIQRDTINNTLLEN